MSEKQFEIKVDDVDSSIINITRDGEDFAWFLSDIVTDKQVEKVVDLLNSLAEENEQLKSKASSWKITCSQVMNEKADLMKQLVSLKEENEQLRLELETHKHPLWSTREAERKINKLSNSLADEIKKNGLLNEKVNQLRIENMRLKKKVE